MALWSCLAASLLLAACASTGGQHVPQVGAAQGRDLRPVTTLSRPAEITVMTLNIAHARRDGFHQLLQTTSEAIDNLDAIGRLLLERAPDIVALQEADGSSFWNGDFDHVAYLAEHGAFRHHVRGEHVRAPRLAYGTALLSAVELRDPLTVTFQPGLSPLPKGFLVSTFHWPQRPDLAVDVVSLHLDPVNPSVRRRQAGELIAALRTRGHPTIMMGDFNAEWSARSSAVRLIAETLNLKAYRPEQAAMDTFPALGRRLDWILVSPHFDFLSHHTLTEPVSDHRGVVARLRLALPATGSL
ncbi:MAG: endonuclease/exonuclease/phosphatase family protein [Gammaproteobacteria bacterium]